MDLFGLIQTMQTGGQPYSDTSPYEVRECSMVCVSNNVCLFLLSLHRFYFNSLCHSLVPSSFFRPFSFFVFLASRQKFVNPNEN